MATLKLAEQRSGRLKRPDPTSPPDTPTASPSQVRKPKPSAYGQSIGSNPDPRIRPVGNGHQFSYRPFAGPEQLSPRSTSSSSSASSDDESDQSDAEEHNIQQNSSIHQHPLSRPQPNPLHSNLSKAAQDGDAGSSDDADSEPEMDTESDSEQESQSEFSEKQTYENISNNDRLDAQESEDKHDSDGGESSSDDSSRRQPRRRITKLTVSYDEFIIQEMDSMDSECDRLQVIHPTEIESNRSRSKSSQRQRELPIRIMRDLRNLNCSNGLSDEDMEESIDDGENQNNAEVEQDQGDPEEAFYKRQQELRRRRVSVSSSIGKRTHSEVSDSDGDDASAMDVNEVGSSARKLRKRVHRGSLLFQDPPEPRIDELDEPDSSEEEQNANQTFARELPFFQIEIMEMDNSS